MEAVETAAATASVTRIEVKNGIDKGTTWTKKPLDRSSLKTAGESSG
jgi:hypothetical protein